MYVWVCKCVRVRVCAKQNTIHTTTQKKGTECSVLCYACLCLQTVMCVTILHYISLVHHVPQQIIISGAGTSKVNGVYDLQKDFINGRRWWKKEKVSVIVSIIILNLIFFSKKKKKIVCHWLNLKTKKFLANEGQHENMWVFFHSRFFFAHETAFSNKSSHAPCTWTLISFSKIVSFSLTCIFGVFFPPLYFNYNSKLDLTHPVFLADRKFPKLSSWHPFFFLLCS